jgi:hypothetical protein
LSSTIEGEGVSFWKLFGIFGTLLIFFEVPLYAVSAFEVGIELFNPLSTLEAIHRGRDPKLSA